MKSDDPSLKYVELTLGIENGWKHDWEICSLTMGELEKENKWLRDNHNGFLTSKVTAEKIRRIKRFIKAGGILPPIQLGGGNRLLNGRHRYTACKQLGMKVLPVVRTTGAGSGKVVRDSIYLKKKGRFKTITYWKDCIWQPELTKI